MALKHELKEKGIAMNTYEASVSFDELKQNSDGLIPVVVQDYKTQEVLMVAYMNREAFETTVRTGRLTYFSRSRQELWIKGLTSGHFQYVKELRIDCDNDTPSGRRYTRSVQPAIRTAAAFYRPDSEKKSTTIPIR